MSLRIPRKLRAVCALFALAGYVLPLAVGLGSFVAHDAEHVLMAFREMKLRAEAMGVAHLHQQPQHRLYVHSHGGAPHAHDAGVGALLAASEDLDEHHDEARKTPVELAGHLPATAEVAIPHLEARRPRFAALATAAPRNLLPPPLPPPRA